VSKSIKVTLGIIGLLLTGIVLLSGCIPSTGTTSGSTGTGGFDWTIIIFLVVIFGLMYLLMIRPQRNRQKQLQKMVEELKRGDEVITNSGIYGVIESVEETSFVLKLEDGAKMRVIKSAVAGKRPEV
jgi:preprotein translocase subunit YajC